MESDRIFDVWNKLKKQLHHKQRRLEFNEGDIWWCGVGKNIGVEIFGKSRNFSRPILVYKKFNKYSFLGIPLTSREHDGSWYVNFSFQKKQQCAILVQAKSMSASRLYVRMGEIDEVDFKKIRTAFLRFYS